MLVGSMVLLGCTDPARTEPTATSSSTGTPASTDAPGSTEAPSTTLGITPNATVVRIVDGDTIIVDFGSSRERVRLIGIDTPETHTANSVPECFGDAASDFTASLLPPAEDIRVERDVEARDDYDRLLGYIYRARDGLFVNLAIIAEGYATPLTIRPNDAFADEFVDAALDAQAADIGLWAACSG